MLVELELSRCLTGVKRMDFDGGVAAWSDPDISLVDNRIRYILRVEAYCKSLQSQTVE